jgi:hypothetical protein
VRAVLGRIRHRATTVSSDGKSSCPQGVRSLRPPPLTDPSRQGALEGPPFVGTHSKRAGGSADSEEPSTSGESRAARRPLHAKRLTNVAVVSLSLADRVREPRPHPVGSGFHSGRPLRFPLGSSFRQRAGGGRDLGTFPPPGRPAAPRRPATTKISSSSIDSDTGGFFSREPQRATCELRRTEGESK